MPKKSKGRSSKKDRSARKKSASRSRLSKKKKQKSAPAKQKHETVEKILENYKTSAATNNSPVETN